MNEPNEGMFKIEQKENASNIELHPFSRQDAKDYFDLVEKNREYFSNFDNMDPDKYQTMEEVENVLDSPGDKVRYGIYHKKKLIGTINVSPVEGDEKMAEIGYLVAEKHSNKGIATEALKKALGILKKDYDRVIADAHVNNVASQRVLEKAGFERISGKEINRGDEDKYFFIIKTIR